MNISQSRSTTGTTSTNLPNRAEGKGTELMTDNAVRVAIAAAVYMLCATGPVAAQAMDKSKTSLGSLMIESPERKRQFLIGLAEALSAKHPKLRLSALTKCFEDAADFPSNWSKEAKLFVPACAVSASGE